MKKIIIILIVCCFVIASNPLLAKQDLKQKPEIFCLNNVENQQDFEFDITEYDQYYNPGQQPLFIPGELIVNFDTTVEINIETSSQGYIATGYSSIDVLNEKFQVISIERLLDDDSIPSLSNCYLFHLSNKTNILNAADEYEKNPQVVYAEPNYLYYHCMMPDDPFFGQQWALHNTGQTGGTVDADIDAPEAWDIETGDPDVVIAVIDTGVDYTNPDSGNYSEGIIEEPFILESSHPLNLSGYKKSLSFSDCDSVSFHITKFETDIFPGLLIRSPVPRKLFQKKLFWGFLYNGTGDDVWTKYSEYGSSNDISIIATGEGLWGFAIDKIKKLTWRPLSEISALFADGYDLYFHNPDPMDDQGHGTHCIGIIAAETNNANGIAGIASDCKIMPIKVGGPSAIGVVSLVAVSRGIVFATLHDADIISMSVGGRKSKTMNLALNFASNRGVILIASAGNSNINDRMQAYPAGHPDVLAVAATDHNDSKAYFSNFGSWVDVAAPGVDIVSLRAHGTDLYLLDSSAAPGSHFVPPFDPNATAYLASGTSMAGPCVAGVAGLVLSKNPNLTAAEVKTILRSSTDSVDSFLPIGTGRINAYTALAKTAPVVAEFDTSIDDQIANKDVEIKGIAKGVDFNNYDIYYAFGTYPADDQWILLAHSDNPAEGKLAVLETDTLREGMYTIKLLVNASGFIYKDFTVIVVDNQPNTFYVDGDNIDGPWYGTQEDPFTCIQYAIESCGKRDEVRVASGIYKESLTIGKNKPISIHGENKSNTIIDGSLGGVGLSMSNTKFITFEGFTITNCKYAIGMMMSKLNKIYNNRIIDNSYSGIFMIYSSRNIFYDNEFINNTNNTFGLYNVNLWYHPLKLRGNYWDDYEKRYPDARPRIIFSWSWNVPYKILNIPYSDMFSYFNISLPIFRLLWNNDRFPLINPS
jgi:parallel beta-helix repeat protein